MAETQQIYNIRQRVFSLTRLSGQVVNPNIKLIGQTVSLNIDQTNTFIRQTILSGQILNSNNSKLVCLHSELTKNTPYIINHNNSRSTLLDNNISNPEHQGSLNSYSNIDYPYHDGINQYILPSLYTDGIDIKWNTQKKISKIVYLPSSYLENNILDSLPYDLQGYTIQLVIHNNNINLDLSNYHNGIINITSQGDNIISGQIENSSCKVIINNITFSKLKIYNCNNVKLNNCNFIDNENTRYTGSYSVISLRNTFFTENANQFNSGLYVSRSRVFIKNGEKIYFTNFDFGIFADNKSSVYINTSEIYLKQNLGSINLLKYRPIFLGAFGGSQIYYNGLIKVCINSYFNCTFVSYQQYSDDNVYHYVTFNDNISNYKYRYKTIPIVLEFTDFISIINHNHKKYLEEIPQSDIINYQFSIPTGAIYQCTDNRLPVDDIYYTNDIAGHFYKNNKMFVKYNGLNTPTPQISIYKDSILYKGTKQVQTDSNDPSKKIIKKDSFKL